MSETKFYPTQAVQDLLARPDIANKMLDTLCRKNPVGWSRRSNAPYFNPENANLLKMVADRMIQTRQDQVFFYKDFPSIKPQTLYLKVYQGIRFLIENNDTPTHRYGEWNKQIAVSREYGVGVRISWKEAFRTEDKVPAKAMISHSVVPLIEHKIPIWQKMIDSFLEDPKQSKLVIDELALSPDEVRELKASLANNQRIISQVFPTEIKIIKV